MTTFSAAHDPWIPVMAADGERLVSLREALCDAHSLTGLATGDPLADVALTRIMVALLLRTHPIDGADDLADLLAAGHLDTGAITTYLDHNAERFDVFGNHPWMQAKGLSPMSGKGHGSTNTLRLEAPSGNNVPLFATALAVAGHDVVDAGRDARGQVSRQDEWCLSRHHVESERPALEHPR